MTVYRADCDSGAMRQLIGAAWPLHESADCRQLLVTSQLIAAAWLAPGAAAKLPWSRPINLYGNRVLYSYCNLERGR